MQLASHLWQNPTVEDLMRALDAPFRKAGSPSAMDSMLPWLQRAGFPVCISARLADSDFPGGDLLTHFDQCEDLLMASGLRIEFFTHECFSRHRSYGHIVVI